MNFIDRYLLKRYEKFFQEKGLQHGLNLYQPHQALIGGFTVQSTYDAATAVDDGYAGNSDVFAIISLIARKAASIPWYVYKKGTGERSKIALKRYVNLSKGIGHPGALDRAIIARKDAYDENQILEGVPLTNLLQKPNPNQSQDQFIENIVGYRILTGEANIYLNDGNNDDPLSEVYEMYALPTQFIQLIPDLQDVYGILGYRLQQAGGVNIPKEDMIVWKNINYQFDPVTRLHLRGISPLKAAANTLAMSNNAAQAAAFMMANGGARGALTPAPVGNMYPNLTPEQESRIRDVIKERVNSNSQKGGISVLQTPWNYLDFGMSSTDMQLIEAMKYSLNHMCRVFGVPVVLFSPDNMADNNYQNALRDLVTNTIVPLLCQLRDSINHRLVPRMGDTNLFVDFDITELPELQRDFEKLVTSLRQADWLTYDEKRAAMDYDPLGGAFSEAYVSSSLNPIGQAGMNLSMDDDNIFTDDDND